MVQLVGTGEVLGRVRRLLDAVDHAGRGGLDHQARLALVEQVRVVARQVTALEATLVAEADRANASLVARGTPTTSWLTLSDGTSPGEAAGLAGQGQPARGRGQSVPRAVAHCEGGKSGDLRTSGRGLSPVAEGKSGDLRTSRLPRPSPCALFPPADRPTTTTGVDEVIDAPTSTLAPWRTPCHTARQESPARSRRVAEQNCRATGLAC